jgi:hypothetical protein
LARIFPRSVECSIKVLQAICEDPKTPVPMRLRCAELILSAYGLASLPPERVPKHNGLRQVQAAVELSATDKKIAGQVRTRRKEQSLKLKKELEKL